MVNSGIQSKVTLSGFGAIKVFKAADLNIIAYPVDFRNNSKKFTLMDLIPSASGLYETSYFVREMIGRTYYKLKYRD